MFVGVLSPIYHSPITIELFTYRVSLRTRGYSSSGALLTKKSNQSDPTVCKVFRSSAKASQGPMSLQSFAQLGLHARSDSIAHVPAGSNRHACTAVS
jgi:hypothetical protein